MKKFLIPIVSGVVGIIIPIAGMTITPTRDLILGLAPEEAVLKLADKIDENRVSLEQSNAKIAELQAIVDSQNAKLVEQNKLIDSQKALVEKTNTDVAAINTSISSQISAECQTKKTSLEKSLESAKDGLSDCIKNADKNGHGDDAEEYCESSYRVDKIKSQIAALSC
ncbi:MAG TPA: hypothetical protein DEA27_00090 [Candidatus Moranbacteria bacterium]|nr:hypothetical protein [Candidatus Moranbacteria bacterium]